MKDAVNKPTLRKRRQNTLLDNMKSFEFGTIRRILKDTVAIKVSPIDCHTMDQLRQNEACIWIIRQLLIVEID